MVNRGVAAWNGKIYLGALDGRLIALDRKTGKVVWDKQTTDTNLPYTITGVPRIVKGKVIIGNGGAEYRVRGYRHRLRRRNRRTTLALVVRPRRSGQALRAARTRRSRQDLEGRQLLEDRRRRHACGTAWPTTSTLDTIYVGTGNGNPWNQAIRSPGGGDNLYLSSIVALDPNTGKYKWHYQTTPGETWDYTATQPIMLADLNYPDGKRRVVMQAPKNGFFYVLDAKDGKLLSAEKFAPLTWATHVDMTTGRPVEVPEARYEVTGKPVLVSPGALGMHNWHPMAFSPETGLVYIPVQIAIAPYAAPKEFKLNLRGHQHRHRLLRRPVRSATQPGAKCGNLETYILAWDPVKAKEVWRIKNEIYGSSGILATSGNLIFSGNHKGEFNAYNATTGEKLWTAPTQARVVAAPSTFMVDGKQEIAILVGARGLPDGQTRTNPVSANNSRILVFRAGASSALPAEMPAVDAGKLGVRIDPPLLTASNETVFAGEQAFAANCAHVPRPQSPCPAQKLHRAPTCATHGLCPSAMAGTRRSATASAPPAACPASARACLPETIRRHSRLRHQAGERREGGHRKQRLKAKQRALRRSACRPSRR